MLYFDEFYSRYPEYSGGSGIPHPLPCEFAINYLHRMERGLFIDVGAHNGVSWSNTLILEELFGWSGIAIEGNLSLYNELCHNRKCESIHCAINDDTSKQSFWSITGGASGLGGLQSGFKNNHESRIDQELLIHAGSVCEKNEIVPQRLDSILSNRNISNVDYLSIDVEGNELGVLKSFDFDNCSCTLISVESNDRDLVSEYLIQFGYQFLYQICADDFYAKD